MKEFESQGCAKEGCNEPRNDDIGTHTDQVPGASLEHGFCSKEHMEEYIENHGDDDTFGQAAAQIEDAGMDPLAFGDEAELPEV